MKITLLALTLITAFASTNAFATEEASDQVQTLNTCTPREESDVVSLKIQKTPDGYGILLKEKSGHEYAQEGGCASLSSPGGGLTLQCAIVLPGRTTGYKVRVHSPTNQPRFAYISYRNSEGLFPKPLVYCDN